MRPDLQKPDFIPLRSKSHLSGSNMAFHMLYFGYQPGIKTYIKCSINLCKTFRNTKEIAVDTSTVDSDETMKLFGILLHIPTSIYVLWTTRAKQSLKDSSIHKDMKYTQVYNCGTL